MYRTPPSQHRSVSYYKKLLREERTLWWIALPGLALLPLSLIALRDDAPERGVLLLLLSACCLLAFWRQRQIGSRSRATIVNLGDERDRLLGMLDSIHDVIVTEDLDGRIQFANRGFYRLFGLRSGESLSRGVQEFIHPDDRVVLTDHRRRCLDGTCPSAQLKYRALRPDGSTAHLESHITAVKSGGRVIGLQSAIRDVTFQRLIERSQRATSQRLEFFVSQMPLGCVIWDADFSVLEWNASANRIFGWQAPEALSRKYVDLLADKRERKAIAAVWEKLTAGKVSVRRECQNLTKNRGKIECEWFHTSLVEEEGKVVAVASMVQDLTQRKNLQRQLIQSQKMQAIGTLAGGIAHDFNNLLTTITGHLSLALMKLGPSHAAAKGLREAEKAAQQVSNLTQQLMRFGRSSPAKLRPIDLNQCVRNVLQLLRHSIGSKVKLERKLMSQLWPVEADTGQLEQVLMNLCFNSQQAIDGSGWIRVESANRRIDEAYMRNHPEAREGEFVELSVSDNGCGIDSAIVGRIFEPFFTTKGVGEGTGLGLAIVYGVVSDHNGWVEVSSSKGQGAVFRVYLPRSYRVLPESSTAGLATSRYGSETVLLVDDEPSIRNLGRHILDLHGYRVLQATNGAEAIEVFQENCDAIAMVVLDLTVPNKSGKEAFEGIRAIKPDVPVVMSSGHISDSDQEVANFAGVTVFLAKPYTAHRLLQVVQEALERTRPAAIHKKSLLRSE